MTIDLDKVPQIPGAFDYEKEIQDNWISQVQTDLFDSLTTVEAGQVVPGGLPFRVYRAGELPAVSVTVAATSGVEWIAAQTEDYEFTVTWTLVFWDGRSQSTQQKHQKAQGNIRAIFATPEMRGSTLFLNRSHNSVEFDSFNQGEVQLGEGNAWLLWSVNTMRCRVAMPNPRME